MELFRAVKSGFTNIKEGDIVLLKDKSKGMKRPMGIIVKAISNTDGLVRKVEAKSVQHGTTKIYHRPTSELIYLLSLDPAL